MRVTVATYNVHRCVGRDRRHDPGRVLAVLRELDADLIALQELEWNPEEALHVLDEFAAALGATGIPGPTLLRGAGHFGNCVLTRLPVLARTLIDLTIDGCEARGAIDVSLSSGDTPVRVIATHLGLRPSERRLQMRKLLALVPGGRPAQPRAPLVLLGDLNEWFLWGRPLRWLHAHFGHTPSPPTFPSGWPVLALDRIWTEPRGACTGLRVHRSPLARVASDHLPLCATIDWTASR
jgi:endonuclease/exonuclease/phosphatase family metal-dependent hydrolase